MKSFIKKILKSVNKVNIWYKYNVLTENYLKKLEQWNEEIVKIEKLREANAKLSQLVVSLRKTVNTQENTINSLHDQIQALSNKIGNPAEVVKKMLGKPLKWKDISLMTDAEKRQYALGAKQALENETLISEINRLTVELVNDIAKNTDDFQQVLNRRFTLNGIQLIKERLESVPQIKDEISDNEEDLYEAM